MPPAAWYDAAENPAYYEQFCVENVNNGALLEARLLNKEGVEQGLGLLCVHIRSDVKPLRCGKGGLPGVFFNASTLCVSDPSRNAWMIFDEEGEAHAMQSWWHFRQAEAGECCIGHPSGFLLSHVSRLRRVTLKEVTAFSLAWTKRGHARLALETALTRHGLRSKPAAKTPPASSAFGAGSWPSGVGGFLGSVPPPPGPASSAVPSACMGAGAP